MLAEVVIPEVVDMAGGLELVIATIARVVAVAAGGYLAYRVIRRGLAWVLERQEQRMRRHMENAAREGDWEGYGRWGDRYESVWGEDARADVEDELNEEHQLWMK
jgi:hypothetical protein